MPLPERELTPHEIDVLCELGLHLDHGLDESDMRIVRYVQEIEARKMRAAQPPEPPRSPA